MASHFARAFESSVLRTVANYSLASKHDKVLFACSGGKDSTSALSILHRAGYQVEALHIDLGIGDWSKKNKENISSFCDDMGIELHFSSTRDYFRASICYIKSIVQSKSGLTPCAICGVIKKWIINRKARELGADRLATGHNIDDEARTFIMNIINGNPEFCFYSGPGRRTEFCGKNLFVPRIKPLYFMRASDIERYSKEMRFPVLYERCPCSKDSFGRFVYNEISSLETHLPKIKENIVENFLSLNEKSKNTKTDTIKECRFCGEPSRNDICRTCAMLSAIRLPNQT